MSITLRAKRILTGALAGALVLGLLPAGVASAATTACQGAASGTFSDSNPTHQANIDCIAAYNVVNGFADGTFGGSRNITRGQMATFLAQFAATAQNVPVTNIPVAAHTFTDVAGNVHANNIARIFGLGITQGRTATTFVPNATITRAEAATMLRNAHVALGVNLGGVTPYAAFTDLGSSVHASNINILAGAGVISGKTATTFAPSQSILRAETATLLVRSITVLRSQNLWSAPPLVASAALTVVVEPGTAEAAPAPATTANQFAYANPATGGFTVASPATTDSFTIDGVVSSRAAFLAAVTIGDQVVIGTNSYALTNVTRDNILSGVVGELNTPATPTAFNIIEPVTGVALRDTPITITGNFTFYTVDGASATEANFNAAINNGDSVVITGNATGVNGTLAAPRTIALTNRTLTGTVAVGVSDATGIPAGLSIKTAAGATLAVGIVAIATDTVTVDGVAATATNILTVGTNDGVTFSRTGGKNTVAFTNVAPAAVTGTATSTAPNLVGPVTGRWVVGTAAPANLPVQAGAAGVVHRVDGVVSTAAELIAAWSAGDQVTVQVADAGTNTAASINLVNRNLTGSVVSVDVATTTFSVATAANRVLRAGIDYTVATYFAGNTTNKYVVNGAERTLAQFNSELSLVANGTRTATIEINDAGTTTEWLLTSAANTAAASMTAVADPATGTSIVVTFDKPVYFAGTFAAADWTITNDGAPVVPTAVSPTVIGSASNTVTITVPATTVAAEKVLSVTLTTTGAAKFLDVNGTAAATGTVTFTQAP